MAGEEHRIGNLPENKGIRDHTLFILRDDIRFRDIINLKCFRDRRTGLHEWDLYGNARSLYYTDDLTELAHDHIFIRVGDDQGIS